MPQGLELHAASVAFRIVCCAPRRRVLGRTARPDYLCKSHSMSRGASSAIHAQARWATVCPWSVLRRATDAEYTVSTTRSIGRTAYNVHRTTFAPSAIQAQATAGDRLPLI